MIQEKSEEPKDELPQSTLVKPLIGIDLNSQKSTEEDQVEHNAIIFSLKNQVTGLVRALRIFQEFNINVRHIESRKSKRKDSQYEIYVDIDCENKEKLNALLHHLR